MKVQAYPGFDCFEKALRQAYYSLPYPQEYPWASMQEIAWASMQWELTANSRFVVNMLRSASEGAPWSHLGWRELQDVLIQHAAKFGDCYSHP